MHSKCNGAEHCFITLHSVCCLPYSSAPLPALSSNKKLLSAHKRARGGEEELKNFFFTTLTSSQGAERVQPAGLYNATEEREREKRPGDARPEMKQKSAAERQTNVEYVYVWIIVYVGLRSRKMCGGERLISLLLLERERECHFIKVYCYQKKRSSYLSLADVGHNGAAALCCVWFIAMRYVDLSDYWRFLINFNRAAMVRLFFRADRRARCKRRK